MRLSNQKSTPHIVWDISRRDISRLMSNERSTSNEKGSCVIVHMSMASYKDSGGGRSKQENIARAREMTLALKDQIPALQRIEVGVNLLHGPNDCDVVSYSEYRDMDAVKATVSHPAHDALIAFLHDVVEATHTVTYEVDR
jgi:Stress responsive A/B Barrel Domain